MIPGAINATPICAINLASSPSIALAVIDKIKKTVTNKTREILILKTFVVRKNFFNFTGLKQAFGKTDARYELKIKSKILVF